jgi:hypothetical protein
MLPKFRNTAIAAVASLSLISATAMPADAWSEKEQNLLLGATVAAIAGAVIINNNKKRQAQAMSAQRSYQPQYQAPRRTYSQPARYQEPRYQEPRYQPTFQSSVYSTPAAQAFNRLPASERRMIQSRLSSWGYYNGGIDGAFGPQTYRAVTAYAGDTQGTNQLSSVAGAYDFYGQLLR